MLNRLALIAVLLAALPAYAQQGKGVLQSGSITAFHVPIWSTNGVISDGGAAANGKITELGITNTGTPFCINDKPVGSPGGYHQFCIGANSLGGGLIAFNPFGGASPLGLTIKLNGVNYPFPGAGMGDMLAPTSPAPVGGQMVLWNANSSSVTKNGGLPPLMVSTFGADLTGAADATTALNACLTAAGAGGACTIDRGAILKVLGDITIPTQTTLDCGVTFTDIAPTTGGGSTLAGPGIRLASGHSILFGGTQAAVHNCQITPNGMTFPQSSSAAWAGTALNTQTFPSIEVVNTQIVGFDVCINGYGSSRPRYEHVYMDCNGGTASGGTTTPPTSASFITGGEADTGFVRDVKLQAIGSAYTCPERSRGGTGWYAHDGGGIYADNVVVQDFAKAQYYLKNYNNFMAGRIWSDFDSAAGCVIGSSIGVVLDAGNAFHADQVNVNGTETGILAKNAVNVAVSAYIGDLFVNGVGNDCLAVQAGGIGHLTIDLYRTNAIASPPSCGRYAVFYDDATSSAYVKINRGNLWFVNGGASPYIDMNRDTSVGQQLQLGEIITDLVPGRALVGGAKLPGPPIIASQAALPVQVNECIVMCAISGVTDITSIVGVSSGDRVTLVFQGILTVHNGGNLRLASNANFTTAAGSLLSLICASFDGTTITCTELSRSS